MQSTGQPNELTKLKSLKETVLKPAFYLFINTLNAQNEI